VDLKKLAIAYLFAFATIGFIVIMTMNNGA
jgi:hypothetical protein